ncbi:SCO6745 family protein [Candidatus Poriferisodalis sp.]|uniref:SCO6745 family protein n=1 Tax=Candidatus Poriferisodalis sp. TaxID=3101277 RepID=UPI003B01892A
MPAARQMWECVERYHQLCYWAPEVRETGTAAGLKGFWMNYFATRAAPLGAVPATVVESLFFYYAPVRVRRAIPDAWALAAPGTVLAARYEAMDRALRRELGDLVGSDAVARSAEIVRAACEAADPTGRVLFAGWLALEWPDGPHLALWHGCTLLREYRSGCHLVALAAAGLDGCESVVSQVAVDEAPREWIGKEAGWSEAEADAAIERLRQRGWLDADGRATESGFAGRAQIESVTDRLDSTHWAAIGDEAAGALLADMAPINALLPKDDQLDWRDLYPPNTTTSMPPRVN